MKQKRKTTVVIKDLEDGRALVNGVVRHYLIRSGFDTNGNTAPVMVEDTARVDRDRYCIVVTMTDGQRRAYAYPQWQWAQKTVDGLRHKLETIRSKIALGAEEGKR